MKKNSLRLALFILNISLFLALPGQTACDSARTGKHDTIQVVDTLKVSGFRIDSVIIHKVYNDDSIFFNTYVEFSVNSDTLKYNLVHDSSLYSDGWDTLPQPLFWNNIINLEPDTAIATIAKTRHIIEGIYSADYDSLTKEEKKAYKDSLRIIQKLGTDEKVYVTFGRKELYELEQVIPQIDTAIKIFIENSTDPFYAQAVIAIESPNRLEYSWAGAYGPFQLMKGIGLKYGLLINDTIDERADLQKSAKITAKYFNDFCIPMVKALLKSKKITFKESDLWFKLLVLHTYHAGYGNVRGVINKINPKEGGRHIIQEMWQTEYRSFKNASQNYSQVALAALIQLDSLIFYHVKKKEKDTLKAINSSKLKQKEL